MTSPSDPMDTPDPMDAPAAPRPSTGLAALEELVGAWHLARWGDPGPTTMAAKLAEEVGEVCEAAVKVAQGHPRAAEMDYGGELADVVIVALAAASLAGVDLEDRLLAKLGTLAPVAVEALLEELGV